MFGTEHSKTNRLQKAVEYKANEQSTKYLYQNIRIKIWSVKVSTCSFCFYQVSITLYYGSSVQLVSM